MATPDADTQDRPESSAPPVSSSPQNAAVTNSLPAVTQPKGGGAIRGIGEKFSVSGPTGTASASIPFPASPGRMGFGPDLTLSYDSGSGNSPFGFGWQLSLPSIVRKTEKGLPQYQDEKDSDTFILSGVEDLVPVLRYRDDGEWYQPACEERKLGDKTFRISEYKPRIEGLFSQIERWVDIFTQESHWRVISADNVTSIYGDSSESKIFDPKNPTHVFGWLLSQSFDDKGNMMHYSYKAESSHGVNLHQTHECYRPDVSRTVARYPKSIRYGNRRPSNCYHSSHAIEWMFEVVFDYGEHGRECPLSAESNSWDVRPDPYSTYRAGFEIRYYRRCSRILMFHHFPDETDIGNDYLVASLDLKYQKNFQSGFGSENIASLIASATRRGYVRNASGFYTSQAFPPVEFEYSQAEISREVKDLQDATLENLPLGVEGTAYQWLDLNAEGLPGILSQQSGAFFWKPNLGNGKFGPIEVLPMLPSLFVEKGSRESWLDLAGDGRLDLVQFESSSPGFYKRDWDLTSKWDKHRTFQSLPNIAWENSNLRMVDVTGDGLADVLITDEDVFTYFPSRGEAGFGVGEYRKTALDENSGARVLFSDGKEVVSLADMSGDGLSDLVRVRNGEICYWPNLGYGRFGAKVAMDHSPWFDVVDIFKQNRILFADIDGSGTTDMIYLHETQPLVFINQAGNSWSAAYPVLGFPKYSDVVNVQVIDLLGHGTASLVFSSRLAGDEGRQIRYMDLMKRGKPYLLTSMKNNLGSETHIEYSSSTQFYLDDKAAGVPWRTRLPFPVQVVHRVTNIDRICGNRLTSRYRYHEGFFDPFEREYRGFGMVETWDCEEFEASEMIHAQKFVTNYDPSFASPPTLTKRWYDTGAYLRGLPIAREYEKQYYSDLDGSESELSNITIPWTSAPHNVRFGERSICYDPTQDEIREAYRSLKGLLLREEVYGIDGTTFQNQPYTITQNNFTLDFLQPRNPNAHGPNCYAIFFPHPRESIEYHLERNRPFESRRSKPEPRVSHHLNLVTDQFGNILSSISVAYGRKHKSTSRYLSRTDHSKQKSSQVLLNMSKFTNKISSKNAHRLPLVYDTKSYELINFPAHRTAVPIKFLEALEIVRELDSHPREIPFEDYTAKAAVSGKVYRRLLNRTKVQYRSNNLQDLLPFGKIESLALISQSYKQTFTPNLLKEIYVNTGKLSATSLPSVIHKEGGYVQLASHAGYWMPSGQVLFSPGRKDSSKEEARYASNHFYLPHRFRDAMFSPTFDTEISISYDKYDLLVVESRDAVNNVTTVGTRNQDYEASLKKPAYDYRTLKPALIMDPNRNRTEFAYDILGMLTATAVMGKPEEAKGDMLSGFSPFLSEEQKATYIEKPLDNAAKLLGNATSRIVYDDLAYYRTRSLPSPLPPLTATIVRETHAADLPVGKKSRLNQSLLYADGFGRAVQTKLQAEPAQGSTKSRWIASGWIIYNNKGNPVKKYEPLFTETHEFEPMAIAGVSTISLYDPLGRIVVTLNPDHTWSKTVYSPWGEELWDSGDTIHLNPLEDADVEGYFRKLKPGDYQPSWYGSRERGQLGKEQQQAALKSSVFAATPTVDHLDPLGRSIVHVSHNRYRQNNENLGDEYFVSRNDFDIVGNVRNSYDALGRIVEVAQYDMLQSTLQKTSMEDGSKWTLSSVLMKPFLSWDSRGFEISTSYDVAGRSVYSHLREGDGKKLLIAKTVWGEDIADSATLNVRNRMFKHQDQAGIKTTGRYDFKGNLLESSQQMASSSSSVIDWSMKEISLEAEIYNSKTSYDALNRTTSTTQPDGSVITQHYNKTSQLQRVEVQLRGCSDRQNILVHAEYDARGQRLYYQYGNSTRSDYTYDPLTFALRRLVSVRQTEDNSKTNSQCIQDFSYTYDPMHNVTHMHDGAQQRLFFRNQVVDPHNDYTYDALNRLTKSSGREHLGQAGSAEPYGQQDKSENNIDGPNDAKAMGRYTEYYSYDAVGNILRLQHRSHDASNKGWSRHYRYCEPSIIEKDKFNNRLSSTRIGDKEDHYSYEGNEGLTGNITSMPGLRTMRWDFRNQLHATAAQKSSNIPETTWYTYADGGKRIRKLTNKSVDSGCTPIRKQERLYLGSLEKYRKYRGDGKDLQLERNSLHVMIGDERVAIIDMLIKGEDAGPSTLFRYQLSNHLRSAVVETNEKAEIISYEEYYAYGSSSYRATSSKVEASRKQYRYSAKEHDTESGLYYYGLRYYAPWFCRWINPDPGGVAADGPNLYNFCHSNPVSRVDPDGGLVFLIPIAIGTWTAGEIVVGAIVGTGVVVSGTLAVKAVYERVKSEFSSNPEDNPDRPTTPVPAPAPPFSPPNTAPPPTAPPTTAPPTTAPPTTTPIPEVKAPPAPPQTPPKEIPKEIPKTVPPVAPPKPKEPSKQKPTEEETTDDETDIKDKLFQLLRIATRILTKLLADRDGWDDPEWHHTIPQAKKYRAAFEAAGIDVHAADNGRIIPRWMHQLISRAQDKDWREWIAANTDSKGRIKGGAKAIYAERDLLEAKYLTNWLYHPRFRYTNYRVAKTARLKAEVQANGGYFRPPIP